MNLGIAVLLVDENEESLARLRQELTGAGIMVIGATGPGPQAANLTRELHPDVILISVEEPLVRSLRTIEALATTFPDVPLIGVSSVTGPATMRKAMLAGARDFLSKPIDPGELRQAVDTLLRQHENRRLARQADVTSSVQQGSIITVFGAKGGIGKTTVSVNLGIALAQTGQKVALIDLDYQAGAAAVMLNLTPRTTLLDLALNIGHLDPELVRSHMAEHSSGLHLLAAPAQVSEGEHLSKEELSGVLNMVAGTYEYVIVDTQPLMDDRTEMILHASTYILLLTSLEISAIRGAKRCLEAMKNWEFARDKIKVVVNVANSANNVNKTDIQEALGLPLFWSIPHDPGVGLAAQIGTPVLEMAPRSKAARAISEMHYALSGMKPVKKSKGFLFFGRR